MYSNFCDNMGPWKGPLFVDGKTSYSFFFFLCSTRNRSSSLCCLASSFCLASSKAAASTSSAIVVWSGTHPASNPPQEPQKHGSFPSGWTCTTHPLPCRCLHVACSPVALFEYCLCSAMVLNISIQLIRLYVTILVLDPRDSADVGESSMQI